MKTGITYKTLNILARASGVKGRPILVVGNGRSGTSWVGAMIGEAPNTLYYREPCHPVRNRIRPEDVNGVWCRYVTPSGDDRFFSAILDHAFHGEMWRYSGYGLAGFTGRLGRKPRIVVKEVAAFTSVEWVALRWRPEVLIVLRHPAAYTASVLKLSQNADEWQRFRLLRDDPALAARRCASLASHLGRVESVIEAIAGSWAIRTEVVLDALRRHPDWALVFYEEVADDPVGQFRALYDRFSLEWTPSIAAKIRRETTTDQAGAFALSRVSAQRINAWRQELSPNDIEAVRHAIEPFELPVYATAADWQG